MPYIRESVRHAIDVNGEEPRQIGDLNYKITKLCKAWLYAQGESYATYNSLIGVLECAKLEFYRRMVAPYEDQKIAENGDVY